MSDYKFSTSGEGDFSQPLLILSHSPPFSKAGIPVFKILVEARLQVGYKVSPRQPELYSEVLYQKDNKGRKEDRKPHNRQQLLSSPDPKL